MLGLEILRMAKLSSKNAKLFQSHVHGFVTRHDTLSHVLLWLGLHDVSLHGLGTLGLVSLIAFDTFPWPQRVFHMQLKNFEIIPLAGFVRPIGPHNFSREDAHTNLIAQAWTVELVREVVLVEWRWFDNLEIGAIDRHEAVIADVVLEAVLPENLPLFKCRQSLLVEMRLQ
jgi:hypothetical protein